jgi:putative hydrolase of the HAD superfamily
VTQYPPITAVLFDLDSTLIEHTQDLKDLCNETFSAYSNKLPDINPEEFWDLFWSKNYDMWHMMIDGVITGDVARRYAFANTLRALQADLTLANPMLKDWEERIIAATRLYDDTLAVIERLRSSGIRMGIVTNGYTSMQRRKVHYHHLDAYMDFVLISEEVGIHKPDKAIFDRALAQVSARPYNALFVGDTPDTDIEGACNAGLHPVLVDPNDVWDEIEDERILKIRRLSELLPRLGLNG